MSDRDTYMSLMQANWLAHGNAEYLAATAWELTRPGIEFFDEDISVHARAELVAKMQRHVADTVKEMRLQGAVRDGEVLTMHLLGGSTIDPNRIPAEAVEVLERVALERAQALGFEVDNLEAAVGGVISIDDGPRRSHRDDVEKKVERFRRDMDAALRALGGGDIQ